MKLNETKVLYKIANKNQIKISTCPSNRFPNKTIFAVLIVIQNISFNNSSWKLWRSFKKMQVCCSKDLLKICLFKIYVVLPMDLVKKNVCCLNSHPKHNQIIQFESPDRPLKIPVCWSKDLLKRCRFKIHIFSSKGTSKMCLNISVCCS